MDTTDPVICCIDLSPAPIGSLGVCTIDVTDMMVKDLAFSSGINPSEVFIKYEKAGIGNWQPTPLLMSSGSFVSGDWIGHFYGSFTLSGLVAGDSINVMGKVKDNAGNYGYKDAGSYTLTVPCP
jgi:hypothetical protein